MILMIDNYDSFVYNLVQYLRQMDEQVIVYRNDKITPEQVEHLNPTHIIISPGPCTPDEAGVSMDLIRSFAGQMPIMGVCLGHQAIGQVFGGKVVRANRPVHGKTSIIRHDGCSVYVGLPELLTVGRYHSLIVDPESIPDCLEVTSCTPEGEIMGLRHRKHKVEGVQFHPESILTEHGKEMLANFLKTGDC